MGRRVLFRDSQQHDHNVELSPTETIFIGRGLECLIRTDDAMVSRRHSQIRLEGGRYVVEDLGSANGTQVNDRPVQKQMLNHNDVVRCGSLYLRYIEDGPLVPAGGPGVGGVPPKKGGTMVIEAAAGQGHGGGGGHA